MEIKDTNVTLKADNPSHLHQMSQLQHVNLIFNIRTNVHVVRLQKIT